jgi:hypothetical protein
MAWFDFKDRFPEEGQKVMIAEKKIGADYTDYLWTPWPF